MSSQQYAQQGRLTGAMLQSGFCAPTVVEARYATQTDDGVIIRVHNRGLAVRDRPTLTLRTIPEFIAPEGPYSWLNQAIFVGTLEAKPRTQLLVIVRVFKFA